MSFRKVYQVLVDGKVIFSGSYASCVNVYESTMRMFDILCDDEHTVVIAFQPTERS